MNDWQTKLLAVLHAETDDLIELAAIAGYDHKTFYRGANFRTTDLSNQDISAFNLTGAQLQDANVDDLTRQIIFVRNQLLDTSLHSKEVFDLKLELAGLLRSHYQRNGKDNVIEESILIYRVALDLLDRSKLSEQSTRVLLGLANALLDQANRTTGPTGNALLAEAVTTYRDALTVYSREDHPVKWAMITQNLAIALESQGTRTDGPASTALLAEAVTAYRDALTVRTREDHPVDWAMTTQNLAIALESQGTRTDGPAGTALLAEAVTAYRDALTVTTREDHPVDWAMTTQNLANALRNQGTRTDGPAGTALLAEAVTAYRDALSVRTREDHPVRWAETQYNIAIAEKANAQHLATADPEPHWVAALKHVNLALEVFDAVHLPYNHARATDLREAILARE